MTPFLNSQLMSLFMLLMPPMFNFSYGVNILESHDKHFSCKQLINYCSQAILSEIKENSYKFEDNFRKLYYEFYVTDRIARYVCWEKSLSFFYKTLNISECGCERIFNSFHQV